MKLLSKVFIVLMFLAVSIWLALPSSGYPKFFNYNWIIQFILGPLSHLSHIVEYMGIITRSTKSSSLSGIVECSLYIFSCFCIWLSCIKLLVTLRNSSLHIAFLSAIWIFAGIANLYFYGIGTL
jgi:hypothetical protein